MLFCFRLLFSCSRAAIRSSFAAISVFTFSVISSIFSSRDCVVFSASFAEKSFIVPASIFCVKIDTWSSWFAYSTNPPNESEKSAGILAPTTAGVSLPSNAIAFKYGGSFLSTMSFSKISTDMYRSFPSATFFITSVENAGTSAKTQPLLSMRID